MIVGIQVNWLEADEIENKTKEFLKEFHPSGKLPIPIEEIVEFYMKINIILLPNLERQIGNVSALTKDMETIYIDEYLCSRHSNTNRYRFSSAHEIGHILIHEGIYRQFPCKSALD